MCLPCLDEDDDVEDPELPQEDPAVNSLDKMQSIDAISVALKQLMLEAFLTTAVVYRPVTLASIRFQWVVAPENKIFYPDQQLLKFTRVRSLGTFHQPMKRPPPVRARYKPPWMQSNDWIFWELHTFAVDP